MKGGSRCLPQPPAAHTSAQPGRLLPPGPGSTALHRAGSMGRSCLLQAPVGGGWGDHSLSLSTLPKARSFPQRVHVLHSPADSRASPWTFQDDTTWNCVPQSNNPRERHQGAGKLPECGPHSKPPPSCVRRQVLGLGEAVRLTVCVGGTSSPVCLSQHCCELSG